MRSRICLSTVFVLGFLVFTAASGQAVEQPLIPYLSTGYSYAIVNFDDLPGFEQPGYDDSGFSIGDAGFGSGGFCPLDSTATTAWPLSSDLLVRKSFLLPANASAVVVGVAIDNDAQVFVNGADISGGLLSHEGCASRDSFVFPVPDSILHFGGSNLLAVRARDRGVISYLDVEVRADVPENHPPVCDRAAANPAFVWPPNHKMVPVAVLGVTDPDGDAVAVTVTSITQDEPVNGLGDGDTGPDAVIETGRAQLRAERDGGLNGRVYEIHFTADDGRLGQCSGTVRVCVPHDQHQASCTDDGQTYDSTVP